MKRIGHTMLFAVSKQPVIARLQLRRIYANNFVSTAWTAQQSKNDKFLLAHISMLVFELEQRSVSATIK